jgi:hypothetical protein
MNMVISFRYPPRGSFDHLDPSAKEKRKALLKVFYPFLLSLKDLVLILTIFDSQNEGRWSELTRGGYLKSFDHVAFGGVS